MRTSKIASFGLAVFVTLSGCASGPSIDEQRKSYEAEAADAVDKLLAPVGLALAIETKRECEAKFKKPCGLYGGYGPMENIQKPQSKPRGPAL